MKSISNVQYQYALTSSENVIHIRDLVKSQETKREIYKCISCDQFLRPVLGDIRQKHFRHVIEGVCNPETYLHKLAKKLFFDSYLDSLNLEDPFIIELQENRTCNTCQEEYKVSCELPPSSATFNLSILFPLISMEKSEEKFVPDILLRNHKNELIYIEFAVTHFSSEEKRNSKKRIIEFTVDSEGDLDLIQSRHIAYNNSKIRFYNFKKLNKVGPFSEKCKKGIAFFILKNDGRAYILNASPEIYKKLLDEGDISFSKRIEMSNPILYLQEIEKAYYDRRFIKSCFLCRYNGRNLYRDENEGPIFCKFLKIAYVSTQAVQCEFYRADPKVFQFYGEDLD